MSQCVGILGFRRPFGLGPLVHPLEKKPRTQILWFSDPECSPCRQMVPIINRLQREENVEVTKYLKKENLGRMDQYGIKSIPSFFNPETGEKLEGQVSFEQLKSIL